MHPDYSGKAASAESQKEEFSPSTLADAAAVTLVKDGTSNEGALFSAHLRRDWCIGVGEFCHPVIP